MQNTYIFVQSKKSLHLIKKNINYLNGFFNGIGYAFPIEKKEAVIELFHKFSKNNIKIIELPLITKDFESYKLAHYKDWYIRELIKKQNKLIITKKEFNLNEVSEESIKNLNILNSEKNKILKLLYEIRDIEDDLNCIKINENKESETTQIQLKFLHEIPVNYLEEDPPKKPRLLYWTEKDGTTYSFLHKEIVAMLVAAGGVGKTQLCALLALSVATGIPFLKIFEIEKPGGVCFIVGENNNEDIHRLLRKTKKSIEKFAEPNLNANFYAKNPFDLALKNLAIFSVHGKNSRFIDEHGTQTKFFLELLENLKKKEPKEGWQLIILDPISRFAGLDTEKDNALATSFIACVEKISTELIGKPTILITHHKPKSAVSANYSDQTAARGSSGITDGVRWQANLDKTTTGDIFLRVVKTNFTSYPSDIKLTKEENGIYTAQHAKDEERTVKKTSKNK